MQKFFKNAPHNKTVQNGSSFKSPPPSSSSSTNSSIASSSSSLLSLSSKPVFKRTPPMCKCGRRSRYLTVQNPGPNTGRKFYSCSRGSGSDKSRGCGFFLWEENIGQSPLLKHRTLTTPKSNSLSVRNINVSSPSAVEKPKETPSPSVTPLRSGTVFRASVLEMEAAPKNVLTSPLLSDQSTSPNNGYFGNVKLLNQTTSNSTGLRLGMTRRLR